MQLGMAQVLAGHEFGEQADRALLVGQILGMLEGQVEELRPGGSMRR